MAEVCPACGGRVSLTQQACSSCFTDLPWTQPRESGTDGEVREIFLHDVAYMGALPGTQPTTSGLLKLSKERLALVGARRFDEATGTQVAAADLVIATGDVRAVGIEGPEQVEKRVTATRLFLVGIFAFAWKKSERRSYLVLETDEATAIFECRTQSPMELRARLGSWLTDFRTLAPSDVAPAALDPADRLRRLTSLHTEGLITDDEFQAKRTVILGEL